MNSFALVAFFAIIAATSAGLIHPGARILEGPSSRTTVVGPEGSVISSIAPGGKIITEELPGAVAYSAPALVAPVAPAVISAYSAPLVAAHGAPLVTPYAASLPHAGVLPVRGSVDTVVAGPSGTIAASRSLTAADLLAPPHGALVY